MNKTGRTEERTNWKPRNSEAVTNLNLNQEEGEE